MGNNDNLFESLFKSYGSANEAVNFLTELTKEHPYFTAAQFYLLQQTKPGSSTYTKQAAKTAILFNNPLWLNFQLEQFSSPDALPEHSIILNNDLSVSSINNEALISASEIKTSDAIEVSEVKKDEAPVIEEQPGIPLIIGETEEQPLIAEHSITKDISHDETAIEEANIEEANTEDISTEIEPIAEVEKLIDAEEPIDIKINGFHNKEVFKEDERLENDEYNEEDEEEELRNEREIEPMHIKLNFTPDMSTTEETISFEPLHTSDYFAALGIKFSEENKANDKLGKQLKSFTEWLKTMKKIHADQLPQQSEQTDLQIQKMAEKSNAEGETLTEAMAEVLFQQGKAKKAVEVYQKLSLLNPSKSAYFAAKIDQIER